MQRKLIIEEIGQPGLLMIAAQMLMFIRSAPLAQNPLCLLHNSHSVDKDSWKWVLQNRTLMYARKKTLFGTTL